VTDWDAKNTGLRILWSPGSVSILLAFHLILADANPVILPRKESRAASTSSGSMKNVEILETKMVNSRLKVIFFLVLLGCLLSACAQLKEAGRTIGHTTRDVATAIGHGTRDAAKAVGEGVKRVKSAPEDEW
jgi:hypothetical protein